MRARPHLTAALMLGLGCSGAPSAEPAATEAESRAPRIGDPARGRELMAHFECNRCHEGTGLDEVPVERHCVRCHQQVRDGTFDAPPRMLARWRQSLHSLDHAPTLAALARRVRPEWIARFLVSPHDLRPGLAATMPRLSITPQDAAHIAAALTAAARDEDTRAEQRAGPSEEGLALLVERGCLGCHAFSGAASAPPPQADTAAVVLAPDLRHTRDRMTRAMLLRWLESPNDVLPGTRMPRPALSEAERSSVADAILGAPLAALPAPEIPARLPVLERAVRFEEVSQRVLSRTCSHCHADPDFAHGDGGAGNTGGFGFAGRGVNLLDYAGASSGYIDSGGERRSLFALDADGTPHLVRVLMARHAEEAGQPVEGVIGMPLGLPAASPEEIQLVESWISQGRPN